MLTELSVCVCHELSSGVSEADINSIVVGMWGPAVGG